MSAGLPDYVKNHIIYYAGPAKTPEGMPSGSFGPTTAGRMVRPRATLYCHYIIILSSLYVFLIIGVIIICVFVYYRYMSGPREDTSRHAVWLLRVHYCWPYGRAPHHFDHVYYNYMCF